MSFAQDSTHADRVPSSGMPGTSCGDACAFCRKSDSQLKYAYLKVSSMTSSGGGWVARWYNLRCLCCDACYRQGRGVLWNGLIGGLSMLVLPSIMMVLFGLLSKLYTHGQKPPGVVAVALLLGVIASFTAGPIWAHYAIRRRCRTLLANSIPLLRRVVADRNWGLGDRLQLQRRLPRRETALDLT